MTRRIFLGIFFCLICFRGFSFDDGDFQYWNTENVSFKINENVQAVLEEDFRYGDNGGNFYYQHSDLGLNYTGLAEWVSIGVNYRHILEEKNSHWRRENRPHMNITLSKDFFNIGFSNRLRLEYRSREAADDYWRYTDKLTMKLPLKLTILEIQPYIGDEFFYDFDAETLNENRLSAGFCFKIIAGLKGEVYYIWQFKESNDKWNDTHILGTKLKISY